jgi:hypothetical protein
MGQIEQSSCHETEKFSHLLLFEGAGRDWNRSETCQFFPRMPINANDLCDSPGTK